MSCTVVCMPDTSFRWRLDLSISWTSIVKFWNTKELPDKFVQCHKIFEFAHIETHTHTCLQTHTHAHTRMHTHIKERTFCSLAQESPLLFLHYLWHNKQRKRRAKSPSFWKWVRLVDLSWLLHSMLCKNAPAVCFKKLIIGHWVSLLASTVLLPICSASSPPFSPFSFLLTLYKICSFCTWSLLICMLTTRSLSKRELITFVWINFLKRMSQKSCSPFCKCILTPLKPDFVHCCCVISMCRWAKRVFSGAVPCAPGLCYLLLRDYSPSPPKSRSLSSQSTLILSIILTWPCSVNMMFKSKYWLTNLPWATISKFPTLKTTTHTHKTHTKTAKESLITTEWMRKCVTWMTMQCITHWSCLGPLNDVSHLLMFEVPARGWGADVNRPLAILVSNILRWKKHSLLWRLKFSPSCFWISSWQNCHLKMVSPMTRVYPPFKTTCKCPGVWLTLRVYPPFKTTCKCPGVWLTLKVYPPFMTIMFPPGKKNTCLKTKPLSRSLLFDFQDDLKRVVVLYCFKRRIRDFKTTVYISTTLPPVHTCITNTHTLHDSPHTLPHALSKSVTMLPPTRSMASACTSCSATSGKPFLAAMCSGVSSSLLVRLGEQPASSNSSTTSADPYLHMPAASVTHMTNPSHPAAVQPGQTFQPSRLQLDCSGGGGCSIHRLTAFTVPFLPQRMPADVTGKAFSIRL